MDLPREGRWLRLRESEGCTGWITVRYVARTIAAAPPVSPTSPVDTAKYMFWSAPEGYQQVATWNMG